MNGKLEKAAADKPKETWKKIIVRVVILLVLLAVLSKVGWDLVFEGLLFVAVGVLIYDIVKKKKKKYAIVAVAVLSLLAGYFNSNQGISRVASKDDLVYVFGKTRQQIEKEYGQGNLKSSSSSTAIIAYEQWYYELNIDTDKANEVVLKNGSKTLGGISLGNTREEVADTMKKAGLKENAQPMFQGAVSYGNPIDNPYHFEIVLDSITNTVETVCAFDSDSTLDLLTR